MIAQRYTISVNNEEAEPGQFVFPDNDSEYASGFVYDVSSEGMEIVLFEPTDLTEIEDIVVSYEKEVEDWAALLMTALEKNPKMKKHWIDKIKEYATAPTLH